MNLSAKGASNATKATLNANAVEFVPSSLRSQAAAISISDASSKSAASSTSKSILDRSGSSISNNSDDEAQQYWCHQLPDDITPDFKVTGIDDTQGINGLSFSGLSLADHNEVSRYNMLKEQQSLSPYPLNGNGHSEKTRYPVSSYGEYPAHTGFQPSLAKLEKQVLSNDHLLARQGHPFNGNSRHVFLADFSNEQLLVEKADALEFLASQFPCFADETLAKVYFASGGNLNPTIERLSQLKLQADGDLNPTHNSKALSTPNLNALDFPALSISDLSKFSDNDRQNISAYRSAEKDSKLIFRSSSNPSRGGADYASAARKMASQDSSIWKYDRNGSSETNVGSSRSSQVLASSYNGGLGRSVYGDRLQSRGSTHASPVRLETGEAVANIYSEMREEALDHARVRNVYFEQARQAYLIGNKALAKELSFKGQLHNIQMKSAHGRAQESIYRQRNEANWREGVIDLHGLHASEAIQVLKHELATLKNAARSAEQRLVAYICVGTGQHTWGPPRTTAGRVHAAVQHYLLEEEGLDYTEPQAGLLRIVIY